jgi:ABC-type amino acid transport substrate-binding protein
MGSGASDEKFLRDKFGENVNIEFYISATLENQYKDLEYGRIDAVIAQNIQIYQAIQKNSSLKIKVLESPISRSSACFALPKNNNELLKIINDFIKEARSDGTLKKISLKWLGADISEATGE